MTLLEVCAQHQLGYIPVVFPSQFQLTGDEVIAVVIPEVGIRVHGINCQPNQLFGTGLQIMMEININIKGA